jgi:hypothetical protein
MADPELLVDLRDELLHFQAAGLRHLQFEGAGQMQRLDVVHPGEGNLVIAPVAAHQHGDLVLTGALERPLVEGGDALDHVQRIRPSMLRELRQAHAHSDMSLDVVGATRQPHAHATKARPNRSRYTLTQRPRIG